MIWGDGALAHAHAQGSMYFRIYSFFTMAFYGPGSMHFYDGALWLRIYAFLGCMALDLHKFTMVFYGSESMHVYDGRLWLWI